MTRLATKFQGYLPGTYNFYWSRLWDLARFGNEATVMWFI
jgi:hypothetical protein